MRNPAGHTRRLTFSRTLREANGFLCLSCIPITAPFKVDIRGIAAAAAPRRINSPRVPALQSGKTKRVGDDDKEEEEKKRAFLRIMTSFSRVRSTLSGLYLLRTGINVGR